MDHKSFPTDQISPAACVANNLRMITRTIVQAYEDALRPSGITIAQFSTLGSLNEHGPISMLNLAEAMDIDRTTLARNLKLLEKNGLVSVKPSEHDRRVKLIDLTDHGRVTLQEATPLWVGVQQHFVKGLGIDELGNMMQTFSHLRELAKEA